MNKTVKTVLIVVVVLMFVGCLSFGALAYIGSKLVTPVPPTAVFTSTAVPVQPTYTPLPTLTPYPTAVPPTKTPIQLPATPTSVPQTTTLYRGSGPAEMTCPGTGLPDGVTSSKCYMISSTGLGLLYFNSQGKLVGYAVAYTISDPDGAYDAGIFAANTAVEYGWSVDDVLGAVSRIQNMDTNYTYGSVIVRASKSADGAMMYLMFLPSNMPQG